MLGIAAFAVASLVASPAMADDTITYNTSPRVPFQFGSGNDYVPANAAVDDFRGDQSALRIHETGVVAAPSDANGVYSFALGTQHISFDFDLDSANVFFSGANITLTNLLTGQSASFSPYFLPDNQYFNYAPFGNAGLGASMQNSEQLGFSFLNGGSIFGNLGFDPNVNDTYQIDLTAFDPQGAGHTLTAFAQIGSGVTGAVPEPATWAMMLIGFGAIGVSLRRKPVRSRAQIA